MKRYSWLGAILLAMFAGCNLGTDPDIDGAILKWGTSFGMCAGYCQEDLSIDSARATLTRSSRQSERPTLTHDRALSDSALRQLLQHVDVEVIRSLQDVYGCPDCADGGAEYVEIVAPTFTKRVQFEYGAGPPELQSLLRELRALRATFPTE